MIIGRDLMHQLKLDTLFSSGEIEWDGHGKILMKPRNATPQSHFFIQDPKRILSETDRMSKILDAKYEKANLEEVTSNNTNLIKREQKNLLKLLKKYEDLFDGTLGTGKMPKHHISLKEDAKPYHGRAYTVPKAYK